MTSYRTLIVEDSPTFREALKEMLQELYPSMIVDQATDAKEAFGKVNKFPPDLIFMDISLPGESGLDLTKRIKEKFPQTVIIIVTNYDLPEYREAAGRYGANYFLSKGASSVTEISALLDTLLAEKCPHPR